MKYVQDLNVLSGGLSEDSPYHLMDQRFPHFYSLQFDRGPGRILYSVNHGLAVELEAPVLYLLHPRNHYRYGPAPGMRLAWRHNWVVFSGSRARAMFEQGFMALLPTGWMRVSRDEEFSAYFREMIFALHDVTPLTNVKTALALEKLLALVCEMRLVAEGESEHSAFIKDLAEGIRLQPAQDRDFQRIARNAGLSYSHFRKLFRDRVGVSPLAYQIRMRMRWAGRQLRSGSSRVKEIAIACGYEDRSYFYRLFKKHFGLGPREYRRMAGGP